MEAVSAIIMAAGLSRRMGRNKLLLPVNGKPMLLHTVELVLEMGFFQTILVTTPNILAEIGIPEGVEVILNPNPEQGQSSSLRLGVEAARGERYMFFTGDQPFLDKATIRRLLDSPRERSIIIPTAGGKAGSPTIFPAALRGELLALMGDTGGRAVRDSHPELCEYIEVPPHVLADVDTPGDYERIRQPVVAKPPRNS